jgi:threonine aldolase
LEAAGLLFYRIRPGLIRLVTSWQTVDDDVDRTLERFANVLGNTR